MSRRKCVFNENLQKDYPFLKKSTTSIHHVFCTICCFDFSIASGGKSHVVSHLKSERHKKATKCVSKNKLMTSYQNVDLTEKLAAAEGTFAYHNVQHNNSFRLMDCTSKIMKKIHDSSFSCGRTKTEAIVENVFSKLSIEELKNDLDAASFVSLYCDASNHGNLKLFPILVRYFNVKEGICVKLLELDNLRGETADLILNYILQTIQLNKLSTKVFGFCADNTNTNFGGVLRKGSNNVFSKLQSELNLNIVGIGCAAHILNNTMQTAADTLPLDIESILVKIYSHFHVYTVRVETLKDFCNFVDSEYHQILGYCKTRWLSLVPAVERLIEMFCPLKAYFLSLNKCPTLIKAFFEDETSEAWLHFVFKQASMFHNAVKEVEGQNTSVIDVADVLIKTVQKMKGKLEDQFVPAEISEMLLHSIKKNEILENIFSFYDTCVQYLEKWIKPFEIFANFACLNLKRVPSWKDMEKCYKCIIGIRSDIVIDDNIFHDEFTCLKLFVGEGKIAAWNEINLPIDARWCETFKYFNENHMSCDNLMKLISAVLCLPGSNAPTERVFAAINNIWTSEKTSLTVSTLKAILLVKLNLNYSCVDFHKRLLEDKDLLQRISSSEKYKL